MGLFRRRHNTSKTVKQRFNGRSLIVHSGFPESWLKELLSEPGGGNFFRMDIRVQGGTKPTPVEKFIHEQVLPLNVPLPFLAKVEEEDFYIRHLLRDGSLIDPSEVGLMHSEIKERYHFRLSLRKAKTEIYPGMALNENEIDINQFINY